MIYFELFIQFFKIGLFTFGGGYAMIPLVKESSVDNGWLTVEEFSNLIGVCESTPGPVAINMATYIGSIQGGLFGSVCATLGVVLPSFLIILLIASVLNKFTENKYFKRFIKGVKPIVCALILSTGLILLAQCIGVNTDTLDVNMNFISLVIFVIIVALYNFLIKVYKKKLSAIQLIIISAVLGIILSIIFV